MATLHCGCSEIEPEPFRRDDTGHSGPGSASIRDDHTSKLASGRERCLTFNYRKTQKWGACFYGGLIGERKSNNLLLHAWHEPQDCAKLCARVARRLRGVQSRH